MRLILKWLMRLHGDDAYSLEQKSGVPQPTTNRFLTGVHKSANEDTVKKWAEAYDVSVSQLRGDMPIEGLNIDDLDGELAVELKSKLTLGIKSNANKNCIIPQYDNVGGSMGAGLVLDDQPGQITEWRVTAEWIEKNIPKHSGKENLCIVTGFGDSMKGSYNSGDPLVVDIGVVVMDYDGVYFFRIGNEGFIKRLQRIPGEGIRVISDNKKYDYWTIKPDMDFQIIGRVLKVWKSEEF